MTWGLVAAAVAGIAGVYQADQSRRASNTANDRAREAAVITARQADEANNRANAKKPDTAAALAAAMLSGKSGQASTMLTGAQGVDPSTLTLGKNTLLGS